MDLPPVAIVIPLHNDAATVGACVRAVLARTTHPDWRVVVVDDGSTDGGADALRGLPRVQVLRQARRGCAAAFNAGAAAAPGCDLVRLHADVVVETDGWLVRLAETALGHPTAAVVGARLVYPDGRIQAEGRHFVSGLGHHPQHTPRRAFQPDGAPTGVQEVDSVPGALAYIRRAVFDAVGGCDERYGPAWMDDDDFCIAARHRGHAVLVHGGVKGVHFTRAMSPSHRVLIPETEVEVNKFAGHLKVACQRRQADYWEAKWGWHPGYPDLGEVRRLHGRTAVCWQVGEPLRWQPAAEFPTVDCCLVTCNTRGLLERCLASLARTEYPADRLNVYVVDNASTDGTAEYLAGLAASYPFALHPIRLEVNTGCPIGLNFAVAAGAGELVARLDDDIVLPPDWLRPLVRDLALRPFAGCVGPKIVNDDERQAIQCGPYRHFPSIYGHDDEPDTGQADYFARTTHVRGCCNLYRRDALRRSGPFDGRFSPTQYDDPDHHLAVLQAGYEILYDGRVRVLHKLNNGLGRTAAAVANQKANQAKLQGKWGVDAWEVVERSLELSREGRYLPDDGDTAAWLALGPRPEEFPRRVGGALAKAGAALFAPYDELVRADTRPDVARWIDEHVTLAGYAERNHAPRIGLDLLHLAVNLAPTHAGALARLASGYAALGQGALGRLVAARGLALHPDDPALRAAAAGAAAEPAAASVLRRVDEIGEEAVRVGGAPARRVPRSGGLRVLMVNTYEPRLAGGDLHQMKKTRQHLEALGHVVDLCCAPRPDPRGYDVVHVWNTWFPAQTLGQVKAVRAWRPEVPVVLSPIFWDMREKCWADAAIPAVFAAGGAPAQLEARLAEVAAGRFVHNGRTRLQPREANWRGYDAYQRALLGLVDHLLPQSRAEVENLRKLHGVGLPFTLVRNGAEPDVFATATPEAFAAEHGLRDFVLCVGLVEPRKNQLMLLHALRDTGLPVVVIGRHYDRRYHALCRRHAPPGTRFIDHLPHERLASAYKAARVHALPSWMECASFAHVEAALAGCSLVASDRTSEQEYFGPAARYCDPADAGSIRRAVLAAWEGHAAGAAGRARLVERFRTDFTWPRAAAATVAGYEAALAGRRARAA
jgi:GT2 family glycosyltransferase/glycosyltransferase involved in cell wall biosynthesis